MLRPTPAQLALMTPIERLGFRIGDVVSRRFSMFANAWILTVLSVMAWLAVGRRLQIHGLDLVEMRKRSRAVVVANHRSFFDFFVLSAVLRWNKRCPRRTLFPVRANFFYDHPLGLVITFFLSAMTMFPPIFRDPKRSELNKFALARTISELAVPGTLIGMHPEGTRNKGDDPYSFLRAQPGVGKVILEVDAGVRVVPVFILGASNKLGREILRNLFKPRDNPVWVVFGEEIDFSDLRKEGSRPATQKRAANRCLDVVGVLAQKQRELAGLEGETSDAGIGRYANVSG